MEKKKKPHRVEKREKNNGGLRKISAGTGKPNIIP